MNDKLKDSEDPRLEEVLEVIFKYAAGDLQARGVVSETGDAVDGVMAGINILGEELQARVAEARQAQQALVESEAQLSGIFNATQDGILMAEVKTRHFQMVNTSFCRMLGYSREELLGMSVGDIHPEKDLPHIAREFERMASGASSLAKSIPMQRKDGSVFYADITAVPTTINGIASLVGVFRDITERKQTEEKILTLNKALEEKVQQLLATQEELEQHRAHLEQEVAQRTASLTEAQRIGHLGNWEWDLVNDTLSWSDEIYRIFGLVPGQFGASYEAFLNAVHPEDRQRVDDSVHDALQQQHTYSIEHRILQPNGTLRHVYEQAEVNWGEDGQAISMLGTVQDITERKQVEEQLRKQHAITTQIIETIPMRVFWKDRALHYLGCNTAFARDAGKNSPDELLGKDDFQMGWKDQAELYRADDQRVIDTDTAKISYDEPQTTPTGGQIWLRTSKVPLHDKANEVMGMLGVYEDITERKQDEIKLQLFRSLLDNSGDAIEVMDPATLHFIDINETKYRELGYSREEILSMKMTDVDAGLTANQILELKAQLLKHGEVRFESVHRRKDETTFPVEISAKLVELDKPYLMSIVRDITERKRGEAKVQKLQEQLREQAVHDPLTGLYNRRYLEESMEREIIRAERSGQPIGIVMCDLDHFKRVNDSYGHLVGDEVLKAFAELLSTHSRGSDIVCRFGGEEFLLLLPDLSPDIVYQRTEELRASLEALQIGKSGIQVTASFGVATFPENGKTLDALISAVDGAMYQAKETGRNRVVVASTHEEDAPERTDG